MGRNQRRASHVSTNGAGDGHRPAPVVFGLMDSGAASFRPAPPAPFSEQGKLLAARTCVETDP